MVAFRWIQMSSFLILMLQLQRTTEQHSSVGPVRAGQDVTLHCKNMTQKQHKCNSTSWLFSGSGIAIELVAHGEIKKDTKTKSDRLSVTANCSLVIKKVTSEDAGRYSCRQYRTKGGPQEGPDSVVDLSVINSEDVKTTKSTVTPTIKPPPPPPPPPPTTTTTTKSTTTTTKPPPPPPKTTTTTTTTTTKSTTTVKVKTSDGTLTAKSKPTKGVKTTKSTSSEGTPTTGSNEGWLWFIIAPVALAVVLLIIFLIIRWKKTKENKTNLDKNTAEAEDGVSYVSISFTRKTKSKTQACGSNDDDTVTYSTVKASSSSAGVSTDPSDLYSTVNKPKK